MQQTAAALWTDVSAALGQAWTNVLYAAIKVANTGRTSVGVRLEVGVTRSLSRQLSIPQPDMMTAWLLLSGWLIRKSLANNNFIRRLTVLPGHSGKRLAGQCGA
ncbi:hypothetical protein BO78DRAFT_1523 [Aspergillus sclerotiicarbonarius CBS 121057]|uniref:Uncharacterized protein n=1 Tax=Aspergillus sclerotiicarbonarius (strain CBS 121057 / IBT 28362) TaxID=1448318 RepID=A0A319EQ13_ASPSB|nr:hypothetical protein BO78DRAFT_1523 [Aspergillus sclerotiicarbonarius CBS 121057]